MESDREIGMERQIKKAITWDFQLPIHKVKDLIKICHNFHRLTLWDS